MSRLSFLSSPCLPDLYLVLVFSQLHRGTWNWDLRLEDPTILPVGGLLIVWSLSLVHLRQTERLVRSEMEMATPSVP